MSYAAVRDYVARRRPEIRIEEGRGPARVFIPQHHPPGMEAEVDFGELRVRLAGVLVKCYLFAFRMSYSGKAVHLVSATCGQEAFLEGHVHAFTVMMIRRRARMPQQAGQEPCGASRRGWARLLGPACQVPESAGRCPPHRRAGSAAWSRMCAITVSRAASRASVVCWAWARSSPPSTAASSARASWARVGPRRQGAVAGHGGRGRRGSPRPGGEAGGQGVAGPRVVVGQFAAQAAQRAAAGAVLLPGGIDHDVAPCTERVEAVKPGQERCMVGQVGVGLERDDCPGEVVLVGEVVVDLRGADAGDVADRRGAGARDSVRYMRSAAAATIRVSRRAAFPRARRVLLSASDHLPPGMDLTIQSYPV